MSQVVIENPIINSPFDEPTRHFRFNDGGLRHESIGSEATARDRGSQPVAQTSGDRQQQIISEATHKVFRLDGFSWQMEVLCSVLHP